MGIFVRSIHPHEVSRVPSAVPRSPDARTDARAGRLLAKGLLVPARQCSIYSFDAGPV